MCSFAAVKLQNCALSNHIFVLCVVSISSLSFPGGLYYSIMFTSQQGIQSCNMLLLYEIKEKEI